MQDINRIAVSGRLTSDSEAKAFNNGNGVLNFTIASNRSVKQGDQWGEATSFFNVKYFTKGFDKLSGYLKKGTQVVLEGKLEQESWERDGQKQSRIVINAENVRWYSSTPAPSQSNNSGFQQQSFGNGGFQEDIPFGNY